MNKQEQIKRRLLAMRSDLVSAEYALNDDDLRVCGQYVADVATMAGQLLREVCKARAAADAARDAEFLKGGKYGA